MRCDETGLVSVRIAHKKKATYTGVDALGYTPENILF